MKNFTLTVLMVLISTTLIFSQATLTPTATRADDLSIDFEAEVTWTFDFSPWTVNDIDGLETWGVIGIDFPHNQEPMAYMVFNPDSTLPIWDDPEIQAHSGDQFGACFASVPNGANGNNDWFMSTMVSIGSGTGLPTLTFWAKTFSADYGLERFNVGVSTTGTDPEDFTIISAPPYVEAPLEWTEYIYDLSAYVGIDIYVGIQCVSYDTWIFMIDDIVINPGGGVGIEPVEYAESGIQMFPNPVDDYVNITSTDGLLEVKIFNSLRQMVYHSNVENNTVRVNTQSFESGMYIVQVQTAQGSETEKLMKR